MIRTTLLFPNIFIVVDVVTEHIESCKHNGLATARGSRSMRIPGIHINLDSYTAHIAVCVMQNLKTTISTYAPVTDMGE